MLPGDAGKLPLFGRIACFLPMKGESGRLFRLVWINLFDEFGDGLVPAYFLRQCDGVENARPQFVVGKAPGAVK